ncbi:MAG: M23 family metallopeptidase [Sphingobacterium sp.]
MKRNKPNFRSIVRRVAHFPIVCCLATYTCSVTPCRAQRPLSVHLPLKEIHVTSAFGPRVHPVTKKRSFHSGVDLKARAATIYSVLHARVCATGNHPLLGLYVKTNSSGIGITYGHLSRIIARKGELLAAGSPIGISGSTGRVTGEHLHLSMQYNGSYLPPLEFLRRALPQTQQHTSILTH